jgi:hypothetical protein
MEVGDELGWAIELEVLDLLSGLTLGDSDVKGVESTTAKLDSFIGGVDECKTVEVREALEDMIPVTARIDVARLAVEDIAELRGLDRRHDQKMLTVLADALERRDNVVCMNAVDLMSDDNALEESHVSDGLSTFEERGETVDGLRREREVHVTVMLDLGGCKDDVQLRLIGDSRTTRHATLRCKYTFWGEE